MFSAGCRADKEGAERTVFRPLFMNAIAQRQGICYTGVSIRKETFRCKNFRKYWRHRWEGTA